MLHEDYLLRARNDFIFQSLYICPEEKWVYLRNPKTGSTTFLVNLLKHKKIYSWKDHLKDFQREYPLMMEELSDNPWKVYTTIRDPYDRFLSMCQMIGIQPEKYIKEYPFIIAENPLVYQHVFKQSDFVFYSDGRLMADVLIPTANLTKELHDKFGLTNIENVRVSAKKYPLTRKVLEFVNKVYEEDFKLLNYEKQYVA